MTHVLVFGFAIIFRILNKVSKVRGSNKDKSDFDASSWFLYPGKFEEFAMNHDFFSWGASALKSVC